MAGIKWGIIASVTAFILSFLLGLIAGNQFLRVFLTAFLFGFLFFGLGMGIRVLINNFFPETAFTENQIEDTDSSIEEEREPERISPNVYGEFAVPDMYKIPGKTPELGNIEDLISGAFVLQAARLDRKPEEVYNIRGSDQDEPVFPAGDVPAADEFDEFPLEGGFKPQPETRAPEKPPAGDFVPSFGDDEGLGGLPELDSFAMVFSSDSSGFGDIAGTSSGTPGGSSPDAGSGFSGFGPSAADEYEPDRSQYKGNKPQPLEGDFDAKALANGIRTALAKDK